MSLKLRRAEAKDIDQYYKWAIDPEVRKQSFNPHTATYEEHVQWFENRLNELTTFLFIFENDDGKAVGQMRFQERNNEIIVGLNLDERFRGGGLSALIIKMATFEYLKFTRHPEIVAYVKKSNTPSYKAFLKAGYIDISETEVSQIPVYRMVYRNPK